MNQRKVMKKIKNDIIKNCTDALIKVSAKEAKDITSDFHWNEKYKYLGNSKNKTKTWSVSMGESTPYHGKIDINCQFDYPLTDDLEEFIYVKVKWYNFLDIKDSPHTYLIRKDVFMNTKWWETVISNMVKYNIDEVFEVE